jgi:diguanylate cyclase (GGDEF)-like protein/PAS domain S-box-containing protein
MSLGLVLLTSAILSAGDLLGLLRAPEAPSSKSRVRVTETLASQASAAAAQTDLRAVRTSLQRALLREPELRSAALRAMDGRILVEAGPHRALWDASTAERVTASQTAVPLFRDGKRWGTLELRFRDPAPRALWQRVFEHRIARLVALVCVLGFVAYLLYLRRSLRYLDPSAVVPARVRDTLDVMAEGVLLLDGEERIVLANKAFAKVVGRDPGALLGIQASSLPWRSAGSPGKPERFPWHEALEQSHSSTGGRLGLEIRAGEPRALSVNSSPILDGWGHAKGVIVTFDDVTELERKTVELEQALGELEKSRDEVRHQHETLRGLARLDPRSGVANRRAFVEHLEAEFATARSQQRELCCLMTEVDDFTGIGEAHGVAIADSVLRSAGEALAAEVRASDAVCRYDGAKFAIALPGATPEAASALAERLRRRLSAPGFARVPIRMSFGISSSRFGAGRASDLLRQTEQALRAARGEGGGAIRRFDPLEPRA